MKRTVQQNKTFSERGQSLVEVALFFPIFIILLAGLVEVSQLLVTQNRVSSATRASTRFAANGGQDEGMVTVIMNNVTQTLETTDTVWDIWSIRATIDDEGDGFDGANGDWSFVQIYGISNTVRANSVDPSAIQARVLDEIRRDEFDNQATVDGVGIAAGLQIVGTYAIHDVDSILGLDAMSQLAGFSSIDALTIMRITTNSQNVTNGCSAFPIGVYEGIRSVSSPGTGSNPYPNAGDFAFPNNPPVYESFTSHRPDVPLLGAREGDVFRVQNGSGGGNFGWLRWNIGIAANANTLENSLTWPGDSTDYVDHNDGGNKQAISGWLDGGNYVPRGYIEPGDNTDQSLQIDDFVAVNTGSVNSNGVRDAMAQHVSLDRTLRLIVWDEDSSGTGVNDAYRVSGFAVFRILGYNLTQGSGDSWILAEFIRWDDSCGQVAN